MKYLRMLSKLVEESITRKIPAKLAILFDGWWTGDSHYIAAFATFLETNDRAYATLLLDMDPMKNEDYLDDKKHHAYLRYAIENVLQSSISSVVDFIGDNAPTNKYFKKRIGTPHSECGFIGCHSHCFNIVMQDFLSSHSNLIDLVHSILRKISSFIQYASLHQLTTPKLKFNNVARSSSPFEMMKWFEELCERIVQLEVEAIEKMIPRTGDIRELDVLCAQI